MPAPKPEQRVASLASTYLSAIVRSPIGWWGGGNCLASYGVSWAGLVCNAILTPVSLWRELRSINITPNEKAPDLKRDDHKPNLRALWFASPALFAVVDAGVIGVAATESFYRALISPESAGVFLSKGVAFALYMVGSIGAIHAINYDYWLEKGVTEPLGKAAAKIFHSLPQNAQTALLSTGLWWGAGDCIMGTSELSLAKLATSPLTSTFLCLSVAFGAGAVIRALKTGADQIAETQKRTLIFVAASHVCYGLANFSSSAILMGIAFMSWAVASYRLAETTGVTATAKHSDD
jgi:sulfite exporter TauE/SafE